MDKLARHNNSCFAVEVQNWLFNPKIPSFGITPLSARRQLDGVEVCLLLSAGVACAAKPGRFGILIAIGRMDKWVIFCSVIWKMSISFSSQFCYR